MKKERLPRRHSLQDKIVEAGEGRVISSCYSVVGPLIVPRVRHDGPRDARVVGEADTEVHREVFQERAVDPDLGLLESPNDLLAEDLRRRDRIVPSFRKRYKTRASIILTWDRTVRENNGATLEVVRNREASTHFKPRETRSAHRGSSWEYKEGGQNEKPHLP